MCLALLSTLPVLHLERPRWELVQGLITWSLWSILKLTNADYYYITPPLVYLYIITVPPCSTIHIYNKHTEFPGCCNSSNREPSSLISTFLYGNVSVLSSFPRHPRQVSPWNHAEDGAGTAEYSQPLLYISCSTSPAPSSLGAGWRFSAHDTSEDKWTWGFRTLFPSLRVVGSGRAEFWS